MNFVPTAAGSTYQNPADYSVTQFLGQVLNYHLCGTFSVKTRRTAMTANEPMGAAESPESSELTEGKRISDIAAFQEALAYVAAAARDKSVVIRATDKRTAQILRASVVASLLFLMLPFVGLAKFTLWCVGVADLCFLFALILFIISRFGILRVMSLRHALVCWQLMVGTSLLSMAIAINLVFMLLLFVAGQFVVSSFH